MIKTFRYRIYPTRRQEETLNDQLALCCELYNAALQERRDAWRLERKSISWFDQNRQIKEIKSLRPDVAEIGSSALESTLKRVDLAFKAFFRRMKAGEKPGYPRFRSTLRYDSITLRRIGDALVGEKLRLSHVGWVKIRLHRQIEGTIKTLTVKREGHRWFALFACEVEARPLPFSEKAIGVDVGLTTFATLSNGREIQNPRYYRQSERALRVAQRRVARRTRCSKRRQKALAVRRLIYLRVRNQRLDFHHKEARKLVNEFGLIAIEDLNIKGLASGMLAKSVNDAGWSSFFNRIAEKAESATRVLVKVDPRGTSQTCTCGAEVRKTLANRWHLCLNCGLSAARDHVSAQVILSRAGVQPSGVNVGLRCVA